MADYTDNNVSAAGLAEMAARAAKSGKLPPVDQWNPPYCGEMDMEIRTDGTWFHEGTPIGRPAMVRLFSTILKREGDRYYLVTPAEKVGIRVEDAPFVAIDADIDTDSVRFTTNVGDQLIAGPDHPIRVTAEEDGTPRPYVLVRGALEALIDRKTFYRLAAAAAAGADGRMGIWSSGQFFPLEA